MSTYTKIVDELIDDINAIPKGLEKGGRLAVNETLKNIKAESLILDSDF